MPASDTSDGSYVVFLDTNCFIQLRDVQDLPWTEILPDASIITLMVAPVVVDELDDHKTSREQRRRDRAKKALRLIEEATQAADLRAHLKSRSYELFLEISQGRRPNWDQLLLLDPSSPDDRLVAAVITEDTSAEKVLVSYDAGPLIRARVNGVRAIRSPESWQLPIQADETSQENARMKRQIAEVQNRKVMFSAEFDHQVADDGTSIVLIPHLRPLPANVIDQLVADTLMRHPQEALKGVSPQTTNWLGLLAGIPQVKVDEYNREYKNFEDRLIKYYYNLHSVVNEFYAPPRIIFHFENNGAVTAENFLYEIETKPTADIIGRQEDIAQIYRIQKEPAPPRVPRALEGLDYLNQDISSAVYRPQNTGRTVTDFYWEVRPGSEEGYASRLCAEFRPHRKEQHSFWLRHEEHHSVERLIKIKFSAKNADAPIQIERQFKFYHVNSQWSEIDLQPVLPAPIAGRIASMT